MALPLPTANRIPVYGCKKQRGKRQAHITPIVLPFLMIIGCLLLNLISTVYSNSIKAPMGRILNEKENEYDTVSNHYYSIQNEYAYYNSTQLIRKKAVEELNMDTPKQILTLKKGSTIELSQTLEQNTDNI